MHSIDVILSPELIPVYPPTSPSVYVIIDILRASSTIVAALANGAECLLPIEHVEQARALAEAGHLVGAERNVVRCPFAHFGNDPLEYTPDRVQGREIYLTTTNGTRTLRACMGQQSEVVVGAFTNIDAVVHYCEGKNILAVCAGWQGKASLEDSMYAAALAYRMRSTHQSASDAIRMMRELYELHQHDLIGYIRQSDHYGRLVAAHKEDALEYCITTHQYDLLPVAEYDSKGRIAIRPRTIEPRQSSPIPQR